MRVATKLSGAFGLLVVLLVGLLLYHVQTIRSAVDTSYQLSEISARLHLSSTNQSMQLAHIEESATKFWITRDQGYLRQFEEAVEAFDAGLHDLVARPLSPEERAQADSLLTLWQGFRSHADRFATASDGDRAIAARLVVLQDLVDLLGQQAQRVAVASQQVMADRLARSTAAARQAERVTWGAAAVALTLSLLISGLIIRSIADALARLKEGTRQVAEGNFDYRLDLGRKDEFAQLARDFNTMNHRLGELDRMKRDFLTKVSHDLKTPLASMQETLELLLDEVPGTLTEGQRRLLILNRESGQRLSSMIGKILELSALEGGTIGLEIGTHDLARLACEAIERTTLACGDRPVRVVADFPEPTVLLDCDGDSIVRVLINLLENAVKFTPANGLIRVAGRYVEQRPDDVPESRWKALGRRSTEPGVAWVTVTDHGPGVPDAEKDAIFERFYQSAAGRKVVGRGVGLGLAICREIVDAHHGVIWVSDAPGGGSTFSMLLPRASVREPVAAVARG